MRKLWNFVDSRLTLKNPFYYVWLAAIGISVALACKVSPLFFILVGIIWLPIAIPTVVEVLGWGRKDGI